MGASNITKKEIKLVTEAFLAGGNNSVISISARLHLPWLSVQGIVDKVVWDMEEKFRIKQQK